MSFKKIVKKIASLRFAVLIIVSLAVLSAIGTIVEAQYDAFVASRWVFHSVYMYVILGTLCITLISVMIDRWPWKIRHTGFVLAHIGIILTLIGSLLTHLKGIDGSMYFPIGGKASYISLPNKTEIAIYEYNKTAGTYSEIYSQSVNFFDNPPERSPFLIQAKEKTFKVTNYYHYAYLDEKIRSSEDTDQGEAIRFQLYNDMVSLTRWLHLDRNKSVESINLGPARISLFRGKMFPRGENEILLKYLPASDKIIYKVFSKSANDFINEGVSAEGQNISIPWRMSFNLRFLRALPHSVKFRKVIVKEKPDKVTEPVISYEFESKKYLMSLGTSQRIFSKGNEYVFVFRNERIKLGVEIELVDFKVGRYQGSMNPSSYASDIRVPGVGDVHISMNNPMKYKGFTFYQSSFSSDDSGHPVASILSVNWDPGRPLTYFGSGLIVLGSLFLFYHKKRRVQVKKEKAKGVA